jgi:hypothetical protein
MEHDTSCLWNTCSLLEPLWSFVLWNSVIYFTLYLMFTSLPFQDEQRGVAWPVCCVWGGLVCVVLTVRERGVLWARASEKPLAGAQKSLQSLQHQAERYAWQVNITVDIRPRWKEGLISDPCRHYSKQNLFVIYKPVWFTCSLHVLTPSQKSGKQNTTEVSQIFLTWVPLHTFSFWTSMVLFFLFKTQRFVDAFYLRLCLWNAVLI